MTDRAAYANKIIGDLAAARLTEAARKGFTCFM